jgi:hypothetical protein
VTAQFATSIRAMPNFQHTQIKETLTTHPKKEEPDAACHP